MVSTRRKIYFTPKIQPLDPLHTSPSPCLVIQTLISQLASPQGLTAPLLKSLHYLLIHLSSNAIHPVNNKTDPNELIFEIGQTGTTVTNEDLCRLSDLLFQQLYKRFKQLFSSTYDVSRRTRGKTKLPPDRWAAAEELNLVLRCCLIHLNLLVEQNFVTKNVLSLLTILRKLSLLTLSEGGNEKNVVNFVQLFTSECKYSDDGSVFYFTDEFVASLCFLELSDPCIPFVPGILEVFLDELLVQEQLREYIKLIRSTHEMQLIPSKAIDNIGIVIDVICGHFSVCISNQQALKDFLNKLSSVNEKNFRFQELSLNAAISLLCSSVLFSVPKLVQAHMISLISEATCADIDPENQKPEPELMNSYIIVFERSVNLYTKHMSNVKMDGNSPLGRNSFANVIFQPCVESYIQPATRINDLIAKLDDSWNSHLRSMFSRTECHLVTSTIAYIEESQCILDVTHRDEILSFLSSMVLRVDKNCSRASLSAMGDMSLEDISLLASLLKLMSCSLLQVLRFVRCGSISCKEYGAIVGILGPFTNFNFDLPIQKELREQTKAHPHKHKESIPVLLHFLGLLSISFVTGIEFLVKGCILVIMVLMNLFVFEEGSLDALSSVLDDQSDSLSNGPRFASDQKGAVDHKQSVVLASNFLKIQSLYLSGIENDEGEMERSGIEEVTCNGHTFLKTVSSGTKLSEIDDLADFIECKKGKDYDKWVKEREKYRKWKCRKIAALLWERKKRTWKCFKRR